MNFEILNNGYVMYLDGGIDHNGDPYCYEVVTAPCEDKIAWEFAHYYPNWIGELDFNWIGIGLDELPF